MTDAETRDWLVAQGLATVPPGSIMEGFCTRLSAAGMPLARCFAAVATLHPLIRAFAFEWDPAQAAVANEQFLHVDADSAAWRHSPFAAMIRDRVPLERRRLEGADARLDYPVFVEFRDRGLTDWIGMIFSFGWSAPHLPGGEVGLVTSWTTARPGGFSDAEVARLRSAAGELALALKATLSFPITRGLLATYLGADAAEHVLSGDVHRGNVQGIEAAIFFADLRGFTALADRLDGTATTTLLNACLDAIAAQVSRHGGQILKFMGDGVLATFATGVTGRETACRQALDAAMDTLAALANLNVERSHAGLETLGVDIALHYGTLLYGNVGAADRLDFTVIGAAVNEASRIEALCRDLDRGLLVSRVFRDACGEHGRSLHSMGLHRLRGVAEPQEIFGLR